MRRFMLKSCRTPPQLSHLGFAMRHEFSRISDAHRSLRHVAHWLRICPNCDVCKAYLAVIKAAEHSFALEHSLMDQFGFPAMHSHLEQHARVLRALHCLHPAVMDGAIETGRRVGGELLTDWFALHNETLDTAVFAWASCCSGSLMDELHRRNRLPEFPYGAATSGSASAFGNSTHN